MASSTLTVIDNRTGKRYELPIEHGTIRAADLAQIRAAREPGLVRYDAQPLGIRLATAGALSAFYPEAKSIMDVETRRMQTRRLIGKMPTIAAFAYRHSRGLPYVYPDNDLTYTGNFLSMMFKMTELNYRPDPVLEH